MGRWGKKGNPYRQVKMRHLYLNSNSRENLISFGVNSNTFRENNLKLRLPLNFRL